MWTCNYGDCGGRGNIVETTWRINANGKSQTWTICTECAPMSQEIDRSFDERGLVVGHLYLPIVQPVVGSEQAIAMEVALHAACRLLRTQADTTQAECDEAEQTLALLRQTQAEAWERVHGRAA